MKNCIEPYAVAFHTIKTQTYKAFAHQNTVNEMLRCLNRLDFSDWIPPAIVFLAQKHHSPESTALFFVKLERLSAQMLICGKNVNHRIKRYRAILTELEQNSAKDTHLSSLDLTSDEITEMRNVLDGNVYELTSRRRTISSYALISSSPTSRPNTTPSV